MGVLFGIFHLSIYRIVPTALFGIVITYAVIRSGSIFVGMLLHMLNNGAMVLLVNERWPDPIMQFSRNGSALTLTPDAS